jgi:hypothetical protein
MDLHEAAESFERATRHCDNLIAVHRGYGEGKPGRRAEEVSVNRAVVVIAVASWQSVIQDYALACIDLSRPGPNNPLSAKTYAAIMGQARDAIGKFGTPNGQNVRELLKRTGYDPWDYWTWKQHAGQAKGVQTWRPSDAVQRMHEWLLVRHAIAHGHATLPQVSALRAVRERLADPPLDPTLRLVDAEQCLVFFRRLAHLTGVGLANHLGEPPP